MYKQFPELRARRPKARDLVAARPDRLTYVEDAGSGSMQLRASRITGAVVLPYKATRASAVAGGAAPADSRGKPPSLSLVIVMFGS